MIKTKATLGAYTFWDGSSICRYVGRSDVDVRSRVDNHELKNDYAHVYLSPSSSPAAAFKAEYKLFHAYRATIMNENHPAAPKGTNLKCLVCGA